MADENYSRTVEQPAIPRCSSRSIRGPGGELGKNLSSGAMIVATAVAGYQRER
jgi:hypothetical protein